jgi:hypothetical protein
MNNSRSVNFDNLYALAWSLFPHAVAAPSVASVQIILLHVSSLYLLACRCRYSNHYAGALQRPLEQMEHCLGPLRYRCAPSAVGRTAHDTEARIWAGSGAVEITSSTVGSSADP